MDFGAALMSWRPGLWPGRRIDKQRSPAGVGEGSDEDFAGQKGREREVRYFPNSGVNML
jgi:hypothetical protein